MDVTMSMKEYETLQARVKKLEEESIGSCITKEFNSITNNTYTIDVDEKRIIDLINKSIKEKFNTEKYKWVNRTEHL